MPRRPRQLCFAALALAMSACDEKAPELVTGVSGRDGCLEFELSVDDGVAVWGSTVYFVPKVTNRCAEQWKFIGGCLPLKVAIFNHGAAYDASRPEGVDDDGITFIKLPAGDCGARVEYSFAQGETCEYEGQPTFVGWDPKNGAMGIDDTPIPAGFFDVYLVSYGKPDGPFSKTLLVEVREKQ